MNGAARPNDSVTGAETRGEEGRLSTLKKRTTLQGDKITFREQGHVYNINGQVPDLSITQALSSIAKPMLAPAAVKLDVEWFYEQIMNGAKCTEELMKEAKRQHRKQWDKSAEIGTKSHAFFEAILNNETVSTEGTEPEVENCVTAFMKWHRDYDPRAISTEMLLYHTGYEFCGTLDLYGTIRAEHGKGRRLSAVVDYKCSKGLYPEVAFQTAAQVACLLNEGVINNADDVIRYALRLDPRTGTYEFKELAQQYFIRDWQAFVSALGLKRALKLAETTDFRR